MNDTILLGKQMQDGSLIEIPCGTSQRILVCGKTGTGKSYTLGVLVEELARIGKDIILVVDPQGIFWSTAQPNESQSEIDKLWEFNREKRGFRINILVPGDPVERYGDTAIVQELERRGINIQGLRLNPSDLSPEMWCELFDLDINGLMGIMLFKADVNVVSA